MAGNIGSASGFLEICDAPLYYEIAGIGPTLVLIHEGIGDSRMYDDQFESLSQHFRVLRYDLHGYGRSGKPAIAFTHYEALHSLLNQLDIQKVTLLGMSLGGMIAIDFTLMYPSMVSSLLLMAAGIGGYPPGEATLTSAAPIMDAFKVGDFVRAIDLTVKFWVDGTERSPEEVNPDVRERVRNMYTDVLRRSHEEGKQADPLDPPSYTRLEEISVPTLVVVGTGDTPDILDQANLLEAKIIGARKVTIPRVAHVLNMELPEEINHLILDFLGQQI